MKEGSYMATAVAWRLEMIKEKPAVKVEMKTQDGLVTWTGWLSTQKSASFVLSVLNYLGFTGNNVSQLATALTEGVPNSGAELEIEVEKNISKSGKEYFQVKQINLSGSHEKGLSKAEAVKTLAGLGIEGLLAEKKQAPSSDTFDDDIPF